MSRLMKQIPQTLLLNFPIVPLDQLGSRNDPYLIRETRLIRNLLKHRLE